MELQVYLPYKIGDCECCKHDYQFGCECSIKPGVTWFLCEECIEFVGGILGYCEVNIRSVENGEG